MGKTLKIVKFRFRFFAQVDHVALPRNITRQKSPKKKQALRPQLGVCPEFPFEVLRIIGLRGLP